MTTNILIATGMILLLTAPTQAADRFQLPTCDALQQSPKTKLQAIELSSGESKPAANPSIIDQARKVNAMPLPLIPTEAERESVNQASNNAERQQISTLWVATLDRSPDIQFVINALQPNSNPNRSRGEALRLIGGAMFNGALQIAPLAFGNASGMRLGTGVAAGMLDSVWRTNAKDSRPDLSPAAMASLYSMIRRTADRLVDAYRGYKASLDAAVYAEEEADDISRLISGDAANSADASVYLDVSMKRALREVRLCQQQINMYRKQLLDMAGEQAVAEVDQQIAAEHDALAKLTGAGSWRHPLEYRPPQSASSSSRPTPQQ